MSLLRISRDRFGALAVTGRSWQDDGTLSARYWSEASKEQTDPAGIFYFHRGERPRHADAPRFEGTGRIALESVDRAAGEYTIRVDDQHQPAVRTAGVYLRADAGDWAVLDSGGVEERRELIRQRLRDWDAHANS